MKINVPLCTLILVAFFASISVIPARSILAADNTCSCELFTQGDAKALFNEDVSDGVTRETVSPAGNSCRYTFSKDADVFGVTLRLSTSETISEEGIFDSAKDVFERQVSARKANEEALKKFKEIEELGDGAFWEGTSLWVLKGDVLLIIKVSSALEGSFSNREALDAALEERNLSLSLEVAETVLPRLE